MVAANNGIAAYSLEEIEDTFVEWDKTKISGHHLSSRQNHFYFFIVTFIIPLINAINKLKKQILLSHVLLK